MPILFNFSNFIWMHFKTLYIESIMQSNWCFSSNVVRELGPKEGSVLVLDVMDVFLADGSDVR